MNRIACRQTGCDYPAGGCAGTCFSVQGDKLKDADDDLDFKFPDRTPMEEEQAGMRGLAIAMLVAAIGFIILIPFIISFFKSS